MKLYCLSGLGVDKRAFQNFNPKGVELIHINWVDPVSKESLASYSKRLFDIAQPEDGYNLIGVSFGGMIAAEFSKLKKPNKLFLVSTVNSASELSGLIKFGSTLRLHKIIPTGLMKKSNFITHYLFGTKNKKDKVLLTEIIRDTDPQFLKWSLNAIVHWKNLEKPKGIKIHGNNDKILPINSDIDFIIDGGGHIMIVGRGKEISEIVENEIR